MNFLNPLNLLWLLPMAGLIVLMHILKLRRKDVVVSSTCLWRQVIRDVQANAPFQKLRKNLLLLLQLLAVALFALALARPFWRATGFGGRSVVLVLDASASMTATDVGRSRLDEAKREALQVVDSMQAEDQMMVIAAAARPEALTGFTADRQELARAIDGLQPRETTTNMRAALNLAAALVAARDSSQIDLFSDGGFAPITGVNLGKTRVVFHPVGKAARNVGITAIDYRRSLTGEKTVEVFVTVRNFDRQPRAFNVELYGERNLLDAGEVTLPPGGESADIFELPEPEEPVTLRVQLDTKDDLAVDDRAALVITPRKPIKALLVGEQNLFLENGIKVDPDVELDRVELADFSGPAGYDVVIFDGESPKTLPEGNYLFVDCASDQSPATPGPESANRGLLDPNSGHPLLRYVHFGLTRWTTLRAGRPAGWAQEIAAGEKGAAIVAGEKGKMRAVWIGFRLDVAHGRFPLTAAYPIFLSNTLRWLSRTDDPAASQIRTGAALALDAPPDAGRITITKPDGAKRTLTVPARGGVAFDETDAVGIYTATGGNGWSRLFAANLADDAESNIAPRPAPDFGPTPPGQTGRRVTILRELWPYLASALLLLLALEWWAFHRRVYVT